LPRGRGLPMTEAQDEAAVTIGEEIGFLLAAG
jgi:hypothetical protein